MEPLATEAAVLTSWKAMGSVKGVGLKASQTEPGVPVPMRGSNENFSRVKRYRAKVFITL